MARYILERIGLPVLVLTLSFYIALPLGAQGTQSTPGNSNTAAGAQSGNTAPQNNGAVSPGQSQGGTGVQSGSQGTNVHRQKPAGTSKNGGTKHNSQGTQGRNSNMNGQNGNSSSTPGTGTSGTSTNSNTGTAPR